jgi:hypothetical protein
MTVVDSRINVACTLAASPPSEVSPLELSVADQTRLCHDRDGHPSYNTHLRMYKSREGRRYPANFLSLLAHFKCETCAVTLGARTYRTSKRVQDKDYHTKRQQESEVILTSTSTCSPPRVMRLYTAACLIKSSCLIRPALYLIAARKSTSLKEPSDPAPAFSLPLSQAPQPRLKEQMPCSPYSPQMDRATLFQFVARISSPHARQITFCLLPSCSRQDTTSTFALGRTLTPVMVSTCTRQRVSALLSISLAISGVSHCGPHPHDVRALPVSLSNTPVP